MVHQTPGAAMTTPAAVLSFWFGDDPERPLANAGQWFGGGPDYDEAIRARFAETVERAAAGELDAWKDSPEGRLAWIILLDQFPRNLHRDSGQAFASDALAQQACLDGIEQGHDRALPAAQRWFLYMPLMHAEDRALQRRSVELFEAQAAETDGEIGAAMANAAEFARKHAAIIERFGRFPHRNVDLGRETTAEEATFLEREGRGF
jgi:uncharacterized protein (DUF924 family)